MIFELNYANQEKELAEGRRRYREQMNSQYTAGYTDAEEKYKAEIAEKTLSSRKGMLKLPKKKLSSPKRKMNLLKKKLSPLS